MKKFIRPRRLLALILMLALIPITVIPGGAENGTSFEASYGAKSDAEGDSLSVTLAGTAGHPIRGRWYSAIPTSATELSLSFTMERITPVAPSFALQMIGSDRKHTPYTLLSLNDKNGVWLFDGAYRIAVLEDTKPLDVTLDLKIAWAESSSVTGTISADVYINGALLDTYSASLRLAGCENYLQFIADPSSNQHINKTNGVLLFDGIVSDGDAADETVTTLCSLDPQGYYGVIKLTDMKTAPSLDRRNFIYTGASMRLMENTAESGLRFVFGVDKAWYDTLEGASVGAIILPTDKLGGAEFSPALLNTLQTTDYVDIPVDGFRPNAPEANDSTYVYYASLINLFEKNYARPFTAVGYVALKDGSRIYTAAQSRSIYEVASNICASGIYEGSVYEPQIFGYLNKVVSVTRTDGGFALGNISGYDSPYTLSTTATGFMLSGNVGAIKAIILDNVIYTGGWKITGNVLTVTLVSPS